MATLNIVVEVEDQKACSCGRIGCVDGAVPSLAERVQALFDHGTIRDSFDAIEVRLINTVVEVP